MNGSPLEIEKDLVQWPRRKWMMVVVLILVAQGVLLLKMPSAITPAALSAPKQTSVGFAPGTELQNEIVKVQDPTLFASANFFGFSRIAWMEKAPWHAPSQAAFAPVEFLDYEEADFGSSSPQAAPDIALPAPTAPQPLPTYLSLPELKLPLESQLAVEDLPNRSLLNIPKLPLQYATDVLRPSIVQVLVETDGSVLSARLLNSSGSRNADGDALRVARKLQFEPAPKTPGVLEIGTGRVIFHWFALDPSQTNRVNQP